MLDALGWALDGSLSRFGIVDRNSADSGLAAAPECTPPRSEGSTPSVVSISIGYLAAASLRRVA